MFNIFIKNKITQEITHKSTFKTVIEMEDWIKKCEANESWGKPQWIEEMPEQVNIATDDNNIQHQTTIPAYQIIHPAEYEIIIEDITSKVESEQKKIEALKQAQLNSAHALQALPAQIDQCNDLESLKTLIKAFVVNVATLLQG